jgi:hypothetical protein
VAETASFPSREAKTTAERPVREGRRLYRTGRNAHMSLKAEPAVVDQFYAICNRENWVMGATLGRALEALERELQKRQNQRLARISSAQNASER